MINLFSFKTIGIQFLNKYLVISIICFAAAFNVVAQIKYSRFEHLTINDGLSSNRIRCLYKDSKDYLWMGTDVGLDRYDSYQVKNLISNAIKFTHRNGKVEVSAIISV